MIIRPLGTRDQPYRITLLQLLIPQKFYLNIASCFTAYCRAAHLEITAGSYNAKVNLPVCLNGIIIEFYFWAGRIRLTPKMLINKVGQAWVVNGI